MVLLNILRTFYVGDSSCDFQDAVVSPRREAEFGHGKLQEFIALCIQRAILAHHLRIHHRVTMHEAAVLEPLVLDGACFKHPFADGGG